VPATALVSTITWFVAVESGINRIARAVMVPAKSGSHQKSINVEWKSRDKSMADTNELTQAELKVLFLIMCVVSSDFDATFKERGVDRFELITKLQNLTGAE
jgi:hypothetical protein